MENLSWLDRLQTAGQEAQNLLRYQRVAPAHEIQETIRSNRIAWGWRFWLWPLGGAFLIELFWPLLSRRAEQKLESFWRRHARSQVGQWDSKIDVILNAGTGAENTVQSWIDRLCDKSKNHMLTWTPQRKGINDIVFPPSATHDTSQEFDHLLVTPHAVYIVETKGWADVQEDGSRQTRDGTPLRSPIEQSRSKRDRLRSILGSDVPVYVLAALPRLDEDDVPFGLDSRFVTTAGEMALVLRQNHQRHHRQKDISINTVSAMLLEAMDTQDRAKVRHMRWLAENHPNEEAYLVREYDDKIIAAVQETGKTIEPAPKSWRWKHLTASLLVALASWSYLLNIDSVHYALKGWTAGMQSSQEVEALDGDLPPPGQRPSTVSKVKP